MYKKNTDTMKSKWKNFLKLQDKEYHVFASYSEDDGELVTGLLQPFENSNCLIYNPDRDGIPGQPIMRGLIEKGMEQSKITMLFITKNFLSDELCMFMANLAIWKYMKTKGIHRVLPIILQPCKIPRYLKVLNCIHVWKYAPTRSSHMIYQTQAIARLTKAMLEPPPKFRRIRWNGIKTLTWTRNIVEKVKKSALKEKASDQSTHKINPFQLWRLTGVLKHCFLNCRYGHCSFACSGREFTRFISHVQICRYRPINCPNKACKTFLPKWCVDKHVEECPLTWITCPSVGCGEKILRCRIEQHLLKCQHRSILCPNHHFGCDQRLTEKDAFKHSETCLFASFLCNKCGQAMMKKDLREHEKYCAKSETKCKLCKKTMLREEEPFHLDACLMAEVSCPNIGCGLTMTRYKMLQHRSTCLHANISCANSGRGCKTRDKRVNIQIHTASCPFRMSQCEFCGRKLPFKKLDSHLKNCQTKKACPLCGMMVPRSTWGTHERTCPRKNWQSYCDVCHKLMRNDKKEDHKELCMEHAHTSQQPASTTCGSDSLIVAAGATNCNMPVTSETRNQIDSETILYKRHSNRKRTDSDKRHSRHSSSDDGGPESMEAYVAAIMSMRDIPVTVNGHKGNFESSELIGGSHCAKSRKIFTGILSTGSSYSVKDLERHKNFDSDFKHFHRQRDFYS
ncbi:unnamed protein product [Mytilus coruscus]|uniref:Uncharacterized protein n=1 Tax=Mytilus coruscus TaxID=42192 RepID=A0A6J8CG05_MYTCO|nr:unnamed protein product [Mytilus coruscus]